MGVLDVVFGPACDTCGTRKSSRGVAKSLKLGGTFCAIHRQQEKAVRRSRTFPK